MGKFNVGDRVECISEGLDGNKYLLIGFTGTVADIIDDAIRPIGVIWDNDIHGHDLNGLCEDGYGWRVTEYDIVIYADDTFEPAPEAELERILLSY